MFFWIVIVDGFVVLDICVVFCCECGWIDFGVELCGVVGGVFVYEW